MASKKKTTTELTKSSFTPPAISYIHRSRYYRHKVHGMTVPRIAAMDNVPEATVRDSIEKVEIFQASLTTDALKQATVELVTSALDEERLLVHRAYTAKKREGGRLVPDLKTGMEMMNTITGRISATMSGKGGVNVSVQAGAIATNSNTGGEVEAAGSGGFESMLRNAKAKYQLPAAPDSVPITIEGSSSGEQG